jgi:hypothetical protein
MSSAIGTKLFGKVGKKLKMYYKRNKTSKTKNPRLEHVFVAADVQLSVKTGDIFTYMVFDLYGDEMHIKVLEVSTRQEMERYFSISEVSPKGLFTNAIKHFFFLLRGMFEQKRPSFSFRVVLCEVTRNEAWRTKLLTRGWKMVKNSNDQSVYLESVK